MVFSWSGNSTLLLVDRLACGDTKSSIVNTLSTSWESLSWTRLATAFAIARKASSSASRETRVRSSQTTATDRTKVTLPLGSSILLPCILTVYVRLNCI